MCFDQQFRKGERVYSAAYIMPSPAFGYHHKHANHLALLDQMMRDGLPGRLASAKSLKSVYEMILMYSRIGAISGVPILYRFKLLHLDELQ